MPIFFYKIHLNKEGSGLVKLKIQTLTLILSLVAEKIYEIHFKQKGVNKMSHLAKSEFLKLKILRKK